MNNKQQIALLNEIFEEQPEDVVMQVDDLVRLTIPGMISRYGHSKVLEKMTPLVREAMENIYIKWGTFVGIEYVETLANELNVLLAGIAQPEIDKKIVMNPGDATNVLMHFLTPEQMLEDRAYYMLLLIRCYVV